MRKLAVAVGLVAVVLMGGLFAQRLRASEREQFVIHVQEHTTNATYVPISTLVGGPGPQNQGDYVAGDDPLFDPDTGQQVGHDLFGCWLVDVSNQVISCPNVTFVLTGRGQIAAGGIGNSTTPTIAPVFGGTGEFLGVKGAVTITPVQGETITDYVFTLYK